MAKAVLVIDDIPENLFIDNLSIEYKLIYFPDGYSKELGVHGYERLRPMPNKLDLKSRKDRGYNMDYAIGYNDCIDELIGD